MHARFFGPLTGRFLSLDPAKANPRNPQSWDQYTYVQNNPVLLTDPLGRFSVGDWWKRALQSFSAYTGLNLMRDSAVRSQYVNQVSKIVPGDSTARTAAKIAMRTNSTPIGRTLSDAMRPISKESSRVGGTASKTNVKVNEGMAVAGTVGKGLLVVGAAVSVENIASAPEGQRVEVASQEAGAWVGALSGGEAGAEGGAVVGLFIGGPPGAAVGAIVGGLGGGLLGGAAGSQAGDNLYHLFSGDEH